MLDPRAPIGIGELEQGVIVFGLARGIMALLLERRLDGSTDSMLPFPLLALQMPPVQLILLQEVAKAGQNAPRSPLGAEAFGHHSWRGLRRWPTGILWVSKPGLEPVLGPVLAAEPVEEEEGPLVSIVAGRPYPQISVDEDGRSTER